MYKVIVAITTYNLEKYVAQALDSVIMQKTNFKFKIRVADDCSTDRTPEILKGYSEKYPELIEVLYSKKNLGSLANSNRLFDHIDCEYFSFLDGDDYWITETRLQEAVDFLDTHEDYTIYGGNTIFEQNGIYTGRYLKNIKKNTFTISDYIDNRITLVHTSALLVRNIVFIKGVPEPYKENETTILNCAYRGELVRYIEHLRLGKMYIVNKDLSVYRIHEKGIWQGKSQLKRDSESVISDLVFCQRFPETAPKFYAAYFNTISLYGEKYLSNYNNLSESDKNEVNNMLKALDTLNYRYNSNKEIMSGCLDIFYISLYKGIRRIILRIREIIVKRGCIERIYK